MLCFCFHKTFFYLIWQFFDYIFIFKKLFYQQKRKIITFSYSCIYLCCITDNTLLVDNNDFLFPKSWNYAGRFTCAYYVYISFLVSYCGTMKCYNCHFIFNCFCNFFSFFQKNSAIFSFFFISFIKKDIVSRELDLCIFSLI